ncbi:hypothetical protein GCM10023200_51480 [Actinomycetospora chlora]|uniref:DUF4190 domain-containing protein n=1 Tax=Actinomycetospora chlora TaxID=663608 RepID=A0ABP9CEA7_9PSEU
MSSSWEPPRDPSSAGGSGGLNPYSDPYRADYGSSYDAPSPYTPYPPSPYAGGPYPGGPYPAQPSPYGPGYQPSPPASGLAIAALVCGILGFFTAGITSIPAVICGHLAWPDTGSGRYSGHGMTIAGLVLGYLPILGWIVFWLIFAVTVASV